MNWSKRICRKLLLRTLGLPSKIPESFTGTFYDVKAGDYSTTAEPCAEIVVTKGGTARKHRIFIVCKCCSRKIPVGRYHQHCK